MKGFSVRLTRLASVTRDAARWDKAAATTKKPAVLRVRLPERGRFLALNWAWYPGGTVREAAAALS